MPFLRSKFFITIIICTLFLVEAIQVFSMLGSFDIEDILHNMAGACIGFAGCQRSLSCSVLTYVCTTIKTLFYHD